MDKAQVWGDDHGYPAQECLSCGQWFFPKFDGARKCYLCWKRSQSTGNEVEELRRQIAKLEKDLENERADFYRLYKDYREMKVTLAEERRAFDGMAESIPGDMLRRLLQLCHPDRHGGSEASKAATQWLLKQRESQQ